MDTENQMHNNVPTLYGGENKQPDTTLPVPLSNADIELMTKMRTYAGSRGIAIERLFKENGGRMTSDENGTITKPKFMTTLLDAFHAMKMPEHGLEALARAYGTGPVAAHRGHLEVAWLAFARDLMRLEPYSQPPSLR